MRATRTLVAPVRCGLALLALFALCWTAPGLRAQCWEAGIPGSLEDDAEFGHAVAIAGDTAVVGCPRRTVGMAGRTGGVTVAKFVGGTWTSSSLPQPTGLAADDRFGHSVAINETADVIVVGAPFHDGGAFDGGLIVIYEFNSTSQTWQIAAQWPGLLAFGSYGWDVDASGARIAVGEPAGFINGAVNVYRRTAPLTWVSDGFFTGYNALDGFGYAVAISGDRMVIGAPFEDSGAFDGGVVRFYNHDGAGWVERTGYLSSDPEGHFGAAVDMDGLFTVVGSPDEDWGTTLDVGAVSFFAWNGNAVNSVGGFTQGGTGQRHGAAVALDGTAALVASPRSPGMFGTPFGNEGGAVTIYRWDGSGFSNEPIEAFGATSPEAGARFGAGVALDGPRALAGAPFADGGGSDAGAVFAYDMTLESVFTDLGLGLAGTGSLTPHLEGNGALCEHTTMTLRLTDALPTTWAYVVVGATILDAPFKGGTMVPNPDLVLALPTDSAGELILTSLWPTGLGAITVPIQYWIVDAGGPVGFSASNALAITSSGG